VTRLSRVTFWLLTAVAIVTFAVLLRQMAYSISFEHLYILAVFLISQGLMIWCLRDLYRRRFSEDRTKLNLVCSTSIAGCSWDNRLRYMCQTTPVDRVKRGGRYRAQP